MIQIFKRISNNDESKKDNVVEAKYQLLSIDNMEEVYLNTHKGVREQRMPFHENPTAKCCLLLNK